MSGKKFDDNYVPRKVVVFKDELREFPGASLRGEVPQSFDVNFIKSQLAQIRNSPSIVNNYFRALRSKFSLDSQIKVLKTLEEYQKTIAGGIDAETDIVGANTRQIEAEKKLRIAEIELEEVKGEREVVQLKKEGRKLSEQLRNEKLRQQIKEVKEGPRKSETALERLERELEEELTKTAIRDYYKTEKLLRGLRKQFEKRQELLKFYEKMKRKITQGKPETEWTAEERVEIKNLKDIIYKTLDGLED